MAIPAELRHLFSDEKFSEAQISEIEKYFSKQKKTEGKLNFAVERLGRDKKITESFLSETINDLKEANKQLKTFRQQELVEKENQLKQITDAMPSSIALVDLDYRYQLNNNQYKNWFGIDLHELKGLKVSDVIGKEMFETIKPNIDAAFMGHEFSRMLKLNTLNGFIDISVIYMPAYDASKNIIGAYVFAHDVTEIKEKERILADKTKELEKYIQTNLQLENFAHLASHDLKAPLTNVLTFSKLLLDQSQEKLNAKEVKSLEFIYQGSVRMQQFIEDLLTYSLAKNRKIKYVDIVPEVLIRNILNDNIAYLRKNQAKVNIGSMPKSISGDSTLLRQIFQNLIMNAVKFVPEDVSPEVTINCITEGKQHLFSVADNGIGIREEDQSIIFGIFKRLHLKSEFPGTGIGLSTCKSAVEKHGGKIWLESVVNNGTTFYFTLPIEPRIEI